MKTLIPKTHEVRRAFDSNHHFHGLMSGDHPMEDAFNSGLLDIQAKAWELGFNADSDFENPFIKDDAGEIGLKNELR